MTFELHNYMNYLFLLDPLKPHFYYIGSGLRGSVSYGEISLMGLLNLVIISWLMFGHELHNYLLYFKVFLLSNMSFQSKEDIYFSSMFKGGENLQLLGRTMGKIR